MIYIDIMRVIFVIFRCHLSFGCGQLQTLRLSRLYAANKLAGWMDADLARLCYALNFVIFTNLTSIKKIAFHDTQSRCFNSA